MGTYNYLFTEITCPCCRKTLRSQIELHFGNTVFMETFALLDMYKWVPRKTPQNGGRPENGDTDGEGYAECPDCGEGYFVNVSIRQDRIINAVPDENRRRSNPDAE